MAKTTPKTKELDETIVKEEVVKDSTEQSADELKALLEKAEAEKAALLAQLEDAKKPTQLVPPDDELRVPVFVPLVPGEDPDQVVTVNAETIKFKKGVWVKVHPKFKQVLDNMFEQENVAALTRERLKMQGQDL